MNSRINPEWAPNQADPEPTDQELIQAARAKGYTKHVEMENDDRSLDLLVKPDADLNGRFKAFCLDELEWIAVAGWQATNVVEHEDPTA
jgi:hypothetical protein